MATAAPSTKAQAMRRRSKIFSMATAQPNSSEMSASASAGLSAAAAASAEAREAFHGDFNLDLLHVASLLNVGQPREAIAILSATRVLPSENARESHALYAQAHLLAGLDALDAGDNTEARRLLKAALLWPEHLGQGRPYEPEERLIHFLLGRVAERLDNSSDARAAFETVVAATDLGTATPGALDLLAIPALAALDRLDQLPHAWGEIDTITGRFAAAALAAVGDERHMRDVIARDRETSSALFGGLTGQILQRALEVSS